MAYRKSENSIRGKKKSFPAKSGSGPGKFEERREQFSGNRSSFISKFSKKRTSSKEDKSQPVERPERKRVDDRPKSAYSGSGTKPYGERKRKNKFSDEPHRAFSAKKKFFRKKDENDQSKSGFIKKPFDREGKPKSFIRDDKRKGTFRDKASRPAKFVSYKTKKEITEKPKDGLIRLNKFISNSGVCSRREADELIKMGLISVNGQVITEMGYKVKLTDDVRHEKKKLQAEKPVYILMNKPKGFITTTDDPQERKTVMHLISGVVKERVYPVGRLDRNTTGLLLLTNDGELAERLTHPSYKAKKIYRVELDKNLGKGDFDKIVEGIRFEEGKAMVDDLAYVDDSKNIVGIEIHIGWNRIVRRIFEALGYEVLKLDRVVYAGLDKKNIGRGEWRFLRQDEVTKLKHFNKLQN